MQVYIKKNKHQIVPFPSLILLRGLSVLSLLLASTAVSNWKGQASIPRYNKLTRTWASYPVIPINQIQQVPADSLLLADTLQNTDPSRYTLQASLYEGDTVTVTGLCVIEPRILTFAWGGYNMLLYDTAETSMWRGLLVFPYSSDDTVQLAQDGLLHVRKGHIVRLTGRVVEYPGPFANPQTLTMISGTEIQPIPGISIDILDSTTAIPEAKLKNVSDFYKGRWPDGIVKFSSGEPYEGMMVEFHNLTVMSIFNAPNSYSFINMSDSAGNMISTFDQSRWFTFRSNRDPSSTYSFPPVGIKVELIRGYIVSIAGAFNSKGYLIVPVYPADLALAKTGSIHGAVFNDVDGNGIRDMMSESVLPGWALTLTGPTNAQTISDADGNYTFADLVPGAYTVSEVQQNGWIQTLPGGTGSYTISVIDSIPINGNDFGNIQGQTFTGSSGGNWSDSANWQGSAPPSSENPVIIPSNTQVVVDALPNDSIPFLRIQDGARLTFSSDVGKLKIASIFRNEEGGTLDFPSTNDSTGLICYSDFVNSGTLVAGSSTISLEGSSLNNVVTVGGSTAFYNLVVSSESTHVIGNIRIRNQLILHSPLFQRSQDTVFIENTDSSAILDTGKIPEGTVSRSILQGSTSIYRFESPKTSVRFTGTGVYPQSLAVTTYPDTETSFNLKWESIGGVVDTVQNTVTLDSVKHFSRWAFGRPLPNSRYGTPRVRRSYTIKPSGGAGFVAQLKLQYQQSEIFSSVPEESLILLKGPIFADSVLSRWNLISLPVEPEEHLKDSLFPHSVSDAYQYDAGYLRRDSLFTGIGYWLKFPSADYLSIYGDDRERDTIPVNKGWNLIGSLSHPIAAQSIRSIPPGIISSSFFGYRKGYYISDSLRPLKGYWLKVSTNGILVMSASENNAQPKSSSGFDILYTLSLIQITDRNGNEQKLYYGTTSNERGVSFDMPPAPPQGSFDVRYSTGAIVEYSEKKTTKEIPIQIRGASYPVIISWEDKPKNTIGYLRIDSARTAMSGHGNIQITNPDSRIVLELLPGLEATLPEQYTLDQNYPNPFNPSTVIKYRLPVESKVTLKIFNILGQEVKTLTDKIQGVGDGSVEWNSTNEAGQAISSGVYFYRIQATSTAKPNRSFAAVKKMLLLK